ncbi:hypothetical protein JL721_8796 [Aureococcus anophagefferens]|nr:hypothetical protein JL721_8796 [Aureococcus anophagefferens]
MPLVLRSTSCARRAQPRRRSRRRAGGARAAGGRPAPRVRPVAGGKIYAVAADDAGLEALSRRFRRPRALDARAVERDELKHQLLESAIKREIIKAEELRREEKRCAPRWRPLTAPPPNSYAG